MPNKNDSIWNDKAEQLLIAGVKLGLTASAIGRYVANGLGLSKPLTRNSIVSKVHRMGKSLADMRRTLGAERRVVKARLIACDAVAVKEKVEIASAIIQQESTQMEQAPADECDEDFPAEKKLAGVQLVDLKNNMCRWPIGDPHDEDFHFCGCQKTRGSYCEHHARLAYQSTKPRLFTIPHRRKYA